MIKLLKNTNIKMKNLLTITLICTSTSLLTWVSSAIADSDLDSCLTAPSVATCRQPAEQGEAVAQHFLGTMYDSGQGVPQDAEAAVKWFRLAAEQGYAKSQLNLGIKYALGEGAAQDDKAAAKWYHRAAEQGSAAAQHFLGRMYANGFGVPQNNLYAYMWFNLAEANGRDVSEVKEKVALQMSEADISEAQALIRQYAESHPVALGD